MTLQKFAIVALTAFLLTTAFADARRPRAPGTGLSKIAYASPPPDFTFSAAGMQARLSALRGKPVVLNFWATWCGPCEDELPAFAELHKTYGDDVVFIAVTDEGADVATAFLHARGVAGLAVSDPARKIFGLYGITPIPVTIVLDRDGNVGHVSVGELDWPELQGAVVAATVPRVQGAPASPAAPESASSTPLPQAP